MTPERWQKIELLCNAALERELNQRAAFLAQACLGDDELLSEVESLLAQEKTVDGFLGSADAKAAVKVWAKAQDENAGRSMIGRQLGSYEVSSLLGVGGMGEVYRALDTKLRRDVAIKVLPAALVHDRERLARFQREARMLASLNHPNIATIHGLEQSGDVHFLVMELVPGRTLAERVVSGGLPLEEVLKVAGQIAEALEAAHEKGVIHRDLKPANVKVTPEGRVKVLDFGLAKVFPGDEGQDLSNAATVTIAGTEDGRILGTPAYMSPEQARGKAVDQRTDIWAFGVVVYELLTGRTAFPGETVFDTIAAVLQREPDWQALPVTTPAEVRDLLRRCLQKDVQLRLQNFGDARIEIQKAFDIRTDLRRQKRDFDPGPAISTTAAPASNSVPKTIQVRWLAVTGAAVLVVGLAVGGWLLYPRKAHALTDKDTVVLADFVNNTGDPVFDDTLRQGLSMELQQSPFLNVISDSQVQKLLVLMGQPKQARLTSETALQVCDRAASAAVLEGSIASLGSQYVLGLRAKNCSTGNILDQEQAVAARREDVLNSLSQIAQKFRTRVGESLATVEKHSTPLAEATTSSLEALKAFSTGMKVVVSSGGAAAIPFFRRAVEIDPKFAMAYAQMGVQYSGIGESLLSAESTTKAWQLRNRVSDREKFFIDFTYDRQVTGNLEKAYQTLELWYQTYPRGENPNAQGFLGGLATHGTGRYERAIEMSQKRIAANPDEVFGYSSLAASYFFLDRFEEAGSAIQHASERKLESPELLVFRYNIAALNGDQEQMNRAVALAKGKPRAEPWMAHEEALALARSGRLQAARESSARAIDLTLQQGDRETAAAYRAARAVWEAFYGKSAEARSGAKAALDLSTGRDVQYTAALALVLSGDSSRSEALAADLEKRFPEDTFVKFTYAPVLHSFAALKAGKPVDSVERLQTALQYELAINGLNFSHFYLGGLHSAYGRGEALFAVKRYSDAAAEFQKILDHRGLVGLDPIGALAHLQLGRALAMSGDSARAKTAYQDFLTLWKDADPDIPILKQAQAEFAKLK